jgi:3-hydroxyacyl-[acyl-carrier-protein] dehydratase
MTDAPTDQMIKDSLNTLDIHKLMAYLPHRYPFLLVDRIINMQSDDYCVGIKNVTVNEPQFTGHFPGNPIFPGVLLIEAMAQTAGALVVHHRLNDAKDLTVMFMTIDNAKFRKPVVPGDQVHIHMRKKTTKRNIWWYYGEAKVDGVLVAQAEVSAMIVKGSAS